MCVSWWVSIGVCVCEFCECDIEFGYLPGSVQRVSCDHFKIPLKPCPVHHIQQCESLIWLITWHNKLWLIDIKWQIYSKFDIYFCILLKKKDKNSLLSKITALSLFVASTKCCVLHETLGEKNKNWNMTIMWREWRCQPVWHSTMTWQTWGLLSTINSSHMACRGLLTGLSTDWPAFLLSVQGNLAWLWRSEGVLFPLFVTVKSKKELLCSLWRTCVLLLLLRSLENWQFHCRVPMHGSSHCGQPRHEIHVCLL